MEEAKSLIGAEMWVNKIIITGFTLIDIIRFSLFFLNKEKNQLRSVVFDSKVNVIILLAHD